MPYSTSPGLDTTPSMSLMPGHSPPESCQPPPEPPSHSPRIALAATMRLSGSSMGPVNERICPVARMQTPISAPRRFVETASREPLGMRFTLLTSSIPRPGPNMSASSSESLAPDRSMPGGTSPAAMIDAFSRPK